MTTSKRHHYIPQFYLKGFTNTSGDYFIFDKQTEEIRKGNPISTFFENNRNSAMIKDEKIVLLEDAYSHFDSITAPQLEKVRNASLDNFILEPEILHRIKMFITQMYWRVPENDKKFENLVNNLTFKEVGFDFINQTTGKSLATPEFQEEIKSVEAFRKMYRLFLPLISAQKKYQSTDYENWKVYFRKDKLHLTSDNPLIIEKFVDFGSLNGELLFPLSSDRLLVHTKRFKPKTLPPLFLLDLDMLILQQATRFVCCPEKNYLEFLVKGLYSFSKKYDFIEQMKKKVFDHFA